jgi:hypothetical protein
VTVAKEIELEDKFENMGAQMVRELASKTHDTAGDGTTTATILAHAMVKEGAKFVASGMNPMDLKRGIDMAVIDAETGSFLAVRAGARYFIPNGARTVMATNLAARGESEPEIAHASRDNEADPAHPDGYSPATNNDRPTHDNPQEVEQRYHPENHAGHHIECSLIHGAIIQGLPPQAGLRDTSAQKLSPQHKPE